MNVLTKLDELEKRLRHVPMGDLLIFQTAIESELERRGY